MSKSEWELPTPNVVQEGPSTKKRDELLHIEKVAQAVWEETKAFEVDAPEVTRARLVPRLATSLIISPTHYVGPRCVPVLCRAAGVARTQPGWELQWTVWGPVLRGQSSCAPFPAEPQPNQRLPCSWRRTPWGRTHYRLCPCRGRGCFRSLGARICFTTVPTGRVRGRTVITLVVDTCSTPVHLNTPRLSFLSTSLCRMVWPTPTTRTSRRCRTRI